MLSQYFILFFNLVDLLTTAEEKHVSHAIFKKS